MVSVSADLICVWFIQAMYPIISLLLISADSICVWFIQAMYPIISLLLISAAANGRGTGCRDWRCGTSSPAGTEI